MNGVGAVQRPAPVEPAPLDPGDGDPAPAGAEQPEQPPPRPAPQPAAPAPDTGTPAAGENDRAAPPAREPAPEPAPQPAPAAQPAPASDAWSVQVGSFSQRDNAQALQQRLTAAGFDAFVSRVVTDAGTLYRVRVGPVPDRAAADRLLVRVRAAGHGGARAVRVED
ncbi:SPOR domain-containing protein [Wenzhouxiangella sp. XN24]|nr:SPOR domain-containing protein [Wenzhouxiangella sp. XN24]